MAYIAGVDVGNNTTEVAIGQLTQGKDVRFLSSSLVRTVGMKGTIQNAMGVIHALDEALAPLNLSRKDLGRILLNEATPVIGDVAMETITETVITESAMIGHNPATPGGLGLGVGTTIRLEELDSAASDQSWIVLVPDTVDFREAASRMNQAMSDGRIAGAIVQNDDGVLIVNRLKRPIPIVDEVKLMDRVPVGMLAAVEVAGPGKSVDKLSNPYDIATLFGLDPDETRQVVPVARALMGTRSAVVIKTPRGDIQERRIPAGTLGLIGHRQKTEVRVEEGAEAIMQRVAEVAPLEEIQGEPGTNVGGMIENVRGMVAQLTDQPPSAIQVRDITRCRYAQTPESAGRFGGGVHHGKRGGFGGHGGNS